MLRSFNVSYVTHGIHNIDKKIINVVDRETIIAIDMSQMTLKLFCVMMTKIIL